jgi:2,4-dienoyl-CoA reductase [(3E)-enoyl-CoA-producing], peroxisomal
VFQSNLLEHRVALITGGGTGICRGIALAFARHGCDVAITSRKMEHLEGTRDELRALGVRATARAADVRDAAAVNDAIGAIASELGRLDILVNGAAGNFVCLAENLSPNGFGTVVDIDLKGTFNMSRAAFPLLKAQGGSVLNISATLPYLGTMGQAHASAAKAGIDSLTRTLAVEWGPHHIRVNGIAPGPIDGTEGVKRLTTEKSRDAAVRTNPLGRMGTLDDIANAALYLSSDAASFVNGVTLVVDGGLWLRSARILGEE